MCVCGCRGLWAQPGALQRLAAGMQGQHAAPIYLGAGDGVSGAVLLHEHGDPAYNDRQQQQDAHVHPHAGSRRGHGPDLPDAKCGPEAERPVGGTGAHLETLVADEDDTRIAMAPIRPYGHRVSGVARGTGWYIAVIAAESTVVFFE